MASSHSPFLRALVVFRNFLYPELIRTVHVYRLEGRGEEQVEREYVFRNDGEYEEIGSSKIFTLRKIFRLSAQFEGLVNGVWLCIFVFDLDRHSFPNLENFPSILSISRNRKLASIPTLANDLNIICQLSPKVDNTEVLDILTNEVSNGEDDNGLHLRSSHCVLDIDLNALPSSESEDEGINKTAPGAEEKKKKRRAATEDISRLALEDLTKYFDLPIVEASKTLKVGLTVLKKKCREFGIPRWPHRKIKSLDGLLHDLREEAEKQQNDDEDAVMLVAKRQKIIESEKKRMETNPFMEIQRETKKFRQDIFKKRHRARALESQSRTLPLFLDAKHQL